MTKQVKEVTAKALTFVSFSMKDRAKTSVESFCQSVKDAGAIKVLAVHELASKVKANISHIKGYNFVEIEVEGKRYERIGFDLFSKALLIAGLTQKVEVETSAIPAYKLALEGKLSEAYERQEKKFKAEQTETMKAIDSILTQAEPEVEPEVEPEAENVKEV